MAGSQAEVAAVEMTHPAAPSSPDYPVAAFPMAIFPALEARSASDACPATLHRQGDPQARRY